jgi:hypothetical protein
VIPQPSRWCVRIYTVDPKGLDADSERDVDVDSRDAALAWIRTHPKAGDFFAVVERKGMRWDPASGWEWSEQVTESE